MQLKDLVGKRMLSGYDTFMIKATNSWGEDANSAYFILDGVTYQATEDPSDGYRSTMEELIIVENATIRNTFPPQEVIGEMIPDSYGDKNDVIQFTDAKTGEVVLELGTSNVDDYYPYCVMNWYPQNLAINRNVGK